MQKIARLLRCWVRRRNIKASDVLQSFTVKAGNVIVRARNSGYLGLFKFDYIISRFVCPCVSSIKSNNQENNNHWDDYHHKPEWIKDDF